MRSTTKSDRVRSTIAHAGVEPAERPKLAGVEPAQRPKRAVRALFTAASAASKGPAGVGLLLAKKGYGQARKQAAQRRAATAERIAESNRTRALFEVESGSHKTRRIVVIGGAAAVVAGVVFFLGRRRNEVPPPADAPPSLADYEDPSS